MTLEEKVLEQNIFLSPSHSYGSFWKAIDRTQIGNLSPYAVPVPKERDCSTQREVRDEEVNMI